MLEFKIKQDRPCLSANSIPSISILPEVFEYFFAFSIASDNGNSIFHYFETALTDNGRQMLS